MDQSNSHNISHPQDAFWQFLQRAGHYVAQAWRWLALTVGSIVLLLVILIFVISLFTNVNEPNGLQERHLTGHGPDKIVVINIAGIIGAVSSSIPLTSTSGVSADQIRQQLQQANDDPQVKAVIMSIDSPGGSAVVSDQIWQQIQTFKTESHKPVIAQFGDTAASGGYYIATAADKIIANPASLTGSIGVILEFYDASGLLNKLGITPGVVKSGPYKDIASFTRPTTPDEQAILQSVVNGAYDQFVERVATGRKMNMDKVKSLADGRIYTGAQAKENGLIDELGNQDKAISIAKQLAHLSSASVVEYNQNNLLQSLLATNSQLGLLQSLLSLGQNTTKASPSALQYIWQP